MEAAVKDEKDDKTMEEDEIEDEIIMEEIEHESGEKDEKDD
jgi:hypothetical protein